MGMNLFAQITKVDEAKREVWGRAVQQVVDKVDEIFDYAKSKPHFEEWSKSFSDATDGKSLGNIRAMHGKTAAGKVIKIDFNDTDNAIDIGTRIVDDNEWNKCLEGVYAGFSIGGSYVGDKVTEKFEGRDIKRYVAKPSEISLVDNPCIPTAKFFDIIKADGVVEKHEFKPADVLIQGTPEQVEEFTRVLDETKTSFGDVIAMVRKAHEASTDDDLIKQALSKPLIESDSDEAFSSNVAAEVKAGKTQEQAVAIAYAVQRKAKRGGKAAAPELVKDEFALALEAAAKAGALTKRLNDSELSIVDLGKLAEEYLTEDERKTLKTPDAVKSAIVAKAGKLSAEQKDKMQAIHDHASSMGADCSGGEKAVPAGDLAKLQTELADATARLKKLEDQPVPFVTLRAVPRAEPTKPVAKEDSETIELTKDDPVVTNFDGSIDYASSRMLKALKATA